MIPPMNTVTSKVSIIGAIAARLTCPSASRRRHRAVAAVYVEAGDHVKRGQILAQLDDSVLVPQVNRLAAALEQARAEAELAAAEYQRALAVEAAGALSAEETEKRRATAVTAAAKVKVAAAQLARERRRAWRDPRAAPSTAPFSPAHVEVGQTATPGGEALFRMARAAKSSCAARSPSRTCRC